MVYRDATINDVNVLDNLLTKLIEDEKKYDPSVENIIVKDFYINYINDNTKYFIVVEDNSNIVAYSYLIKEDDHIKIDALYVLEDYQNKKIGTSIINKIIEYAKLNNFEYITINVLDNNIKAKNLYYKYFTLYKKNNNKEELRMYL